MGYDYEGIKTEMRLLKLTRIDNVEYLKLADVERLLSDLRREIKEDAPFEMNQDGTKKYHLTDTQLTVMKYLGFISNCIMRGLLITCEQPEDVKAVLRRVRVEFYSGKYYLSRTERDESGKITEVLYFRKYCKGAMAARLEAEGKTQEEIDAELAESDGDPVLSNFHQDACLFESMETATSNMTYLNHNYNMGLELHEAVLLDSRLVREMLDKLKNEMEDVTDDAANEKQKGDNA